MSTSGKHRRPLDPDAQIAFWSDLRARVGPGSSVRQLATVLGISSVSSLLALGANGRPHRHMPPATMEEYQRRVSEWCARQ